MRELSGAEFDWNDESAMSFDAASLVDRHSVFEGTFRSQRDIRVEGEVKGTVACDGTLFVAEGATVAATVDAEHISVAGDLSGEIRCRGRLHIMPSGRVRAKVSTNGRRHGLCDRDRHQVRSALKRLPPIVKQDLAQRSSGDSVVQKHRGKHAVNPRNPPMRP